MAINIIIDSSDVQQQIFVEIETDGGKSIAIGKEMESPEGFRKIRITAEDIKNADEKNPDTRLNNGG